MLDTLLLLNILSAHPLEFVLVLLVATQDHDQSSKTLRVLSECFYPSLA